MFPLQNLVTFHVQSSISGGWLDVRDTKTKRLILSKPFKNVPELEKLKETITMQVVSAAILKGK